MRIDEPRENDVILEGIVNFMGYARNQGCKDSSVPTDTTLPSAMATALAYGRP